MMTSQTLKAQLQIFNCHTLQIFNCRIIANIQIRIKLMLFYTKRQALPPPPPGYQMVGP